MERSPFLMGKSIISMAIFHSKMLVYQRVWCQIIFWKNPAVINGGKLMKNSLCMDFF
jgi:hypothetical protein